MINQYQGHFRSETVKVSGAYKRGTCKQMIEQFVSYDGSLVTGRVISKLPFTFVLEDTPSNNKVRDHRIFHH